MGSEPKRNVCLCGGFDWGYVVVCLCIKFIKADSLYSALLSGIIHILTRNRDVDVLCLIEICMLPLETGLNFSSSCFTLLGVDVLLLISTLF